MFQSISNGLRSSLVAVPRFGFQILQSECRGAPDSPARTFFEELRLAIENGKSKILDLFCVSVELLTVKLVSKIVISGALKSWCVPSVP